MDLSKLTDEELLQLAGGDLNSLSDEQLLSMAQAQEPSFVGQMVENVEAAGGALKDLASPEYYSQFGSKLGSAVSDIADYATNPMLRGDVAKAEFDSADVKRGLLEGFAENPAGKALTVLGGVVPAFNIAGAAMTKYGAPAIQEATGASPEDVQLGMLAAPFAAKAVGKVPFVGKPIEGAINYAINKPIEALGSKVLNSRTMGKFVSDQTSGRNKPNIISADDFKAQAQQAFDLVEQKGGTLTYKSQNEFLDRAKSSMPQTEQGKGIAGETPATKLLADMEAQLRDKGMTLKAAQEIDTAITNKINQNIDPLTGKVNPDGLGLQRIQQEFRKTIDKTPEDQILGGKEGIEAWNQGKTLWAQQAKMRDIESILQKAEFAENPQLVIKNGFKNIVTNAKKERGYTKQEIKLMQKAAKTGLLTGTLKLAASGLVPIGVGLTGGGLLGAGVAMGLGAAAKAGAAGIQAGKAGKVMQAISNRGIVQPQAPTLMEALRPVITAKSRNPQYK